MQTEIDLVGKWVGLGQQRGQLVLQWRHAKFLCKLLQP